MHQFKYFIYRPFNNLMAYTTTCEISTLKYLKPKKGTPFWAEPPCIGHDYLIGSTPSWEVYFIFPHNITFPRFEPKSYILITVL